MSIEALLPALLVLSLGVLLVWVLPVRAFTLVLTLVGAAVLGWYSAVSLAVLLTTSLLVYVAPRLPTLARPASALVGVILVGAYAALLWLTRDAQGAAAIAMPLGMAYYVLRTIHYLADQNLGRLRPHGLLDALAYQFTPATLFYGPIHRFDEFQRDLGRRRWDSALFSEGLGRILSGAVKVVVIGGYVIVERLGYRAETDLVAGGALAIYRNSALYWANLYFQFSGFSDIAIGFCLLVGLRVRENFNWPFLATNIQDFWRRWHISLSSWCRDYVYRPVMAFGRSHLLAIVAAMVVLGLWHALSVHYLLWGLYHALGLAFWRQFNALTASVYARLPRAARWGWTGAATLITLHFVIFSFAVTTWVERLILGG